MSSLSQIVLREQGSGVSRLTLADPSGNNVLSRSVVEALNQVLADASADPACRAVIVAAKGEHFCQGLDFASLSEEDPTRFIEDMRAAADCFLRIRRSPVPVIACVQGRVTGGGMGLVAACDLVLALENAVFMLSEVIVGMVPAIIMPLLLQRIMPGRMGYLTLSSRGLGAREAREVGLVDEVVTEELPRALSRQLKRLGCSSPEALAESKGFLGRLSGGALEAQMNAAIEFQSARLARPEVREALRTFAEGMSPPWFQRIGG